MLSEANQKNMIRYRGFIFLKQPNKGWLVRPERSPMVVLPFRTTISSITKVKEILDIRLNSHAHRSDFVS